MPEFKMRMASYVGPRDGLAVELLDESGSVLAEVFRSDADLTVIVSTFGNDIPIQAMQRLLERAARQLDPFENGTPLDQAKLCNARPSRSELPSR